MQSGLRDYWALTVLHGAQPEGVFAREDARPLLARMRTGALRARDELFLLERQLPHALRHDRGACRAEPRRTLRGADVRAGRDGDGGADRRHQRAGRAGRSATRGTAVGFFPATNRIYWTGDAGHLGVARGHAGLGALHRRHARGRGQPLPPAVGAAALLRRDGGLLRLRARPREGGGVRRRPGTAGRCAASGCSGCTCRRGGFRWWCCSTTRATPMRAAVAVMQGGARRSPAEPAGAPAESGWAGAYIDPATDLVLRVEPGHGGLAGPLRDGAGAAGHRRRTGVARCADMTLARDGDAHPDGAARARTCGRLRRGCRGRRAPTSKAATGRRSRTGRSRSSRLAAASTAASRACSGRGPMQSLYPLAEDVWLMPCRRSMDAPAPGDWTVRVRRDAGGGVHGLTVGCWLARRVEYLREQ